MAKAMQKILIAADLSERSDHALERALALTRQFGAELTVLHVVDDNLPASVIEKLRAAAKDELESRLGTVSDDLANRVTLRVDVGDPFAKILDAAWSRQVDLIVVGLHRPRWLSDIVLGATLERLLRVCDRPLLVVREAPAGPYRKVLVAVDFSVCSARAFEASVRLVPEGQFHLVHAFETPFAAFLTSRGAQLEAAAQHARELERTIEQQLQDMATTLPGGAPKPELALVRGEPTNVILDQIAKQHPDLLAVGTHGRTGIARAVLGSVIRNLLRDPPCDVLAVRGR